MGDRGLITSVVRFTTFFHDKSSVDGTWSAVQLIIWTQIKTGIYLISACLPTYRPLLERIGHRRFIDRLTYAKTDKEFNSKQNSPNIPLKFRPKVHILNITSRGLPQLGG